MRSRHPLAVSGVGTPGCRRREGRPVFPPLSAHVPKSVHRSVIHILPKEMPHTPYTTTAPNTAAATSLPSLGSSFEPIMVWLPFANMLPMTLRITMAKTEMTMLRRKLYQYFILFSSFSWLPIGAGVPCPCVEGGYDGLHDCCGCCLIGSLGREKRRRSKSSTGLWAVASEITIWRMSCWVVVRRGCVAGRWLWCDRLGG